MRERILMHANSLSETGTSTSIFEYAKGLTAKGYQVSIAFNVNERNNHPIVISEFRKLYEMLPYSDFKTLDKSASRKFDVGYFLKAGAIDGYCFSRIPSGIHVVFKHFEPHGDAYCYISEWLRDEIEERRLRLKPIEKVKLILKGGNPWMSQPLNFVPHCVDLPQQSECLRKTWGVPRSAKLGIRLGGFEKFDIEWVQRTVVRLVENVNDLYFVFVNTRKFVDHPRIKFEPVIVSKQDKSNALHSADFFIHGRRMGESFGMAILEAMRCKLPVFAWEGGRDLNHTRLLTQNSLYTSSEDLFEKIIDFDSHDQIEKNYLKSLEFSGESVINRFESVFVHSLLH